MTAEIKSASFGGKRNPKQVLADSLGKADAFERVVVVAEYKDGAIVAGWSDGEKLKHIGMLRFAEFDLLRQFEEV